MANDEIKRVPYPQNAQAPNKFYVVFEVTDEGFKQSKSDFLKALEIEIESGTLDMMEYMLKEYDKRNASDA